MTADVAVRFGTDNVRDWFFPFGDGDMLDTAYVGAIATHVNDPEDLSALICAGRRRICVGDVADLVLVPSSSFDDAIARRPPAGFFSAEARSWSRMRCRSIQARLNS